VGPRSPALRYVPYGELAGAPNVVSDGSPTGGTVLCLSHWPGIGFPDEFAADLSAEMAFRYLAAFDRHRGADAVSNNHFDQDGLVGVFALSAPDEALARGALLVEVARAGDFAVTPSRVAARISMAVSAYADPDRSPLGALPADYDGTAALLYTELLGRLPELCDHPDRLRPLWADEDATLQASEDAIGSGAVTIEELPELDLAIVTVPELAPDAGGHRFASQWVHGLHPMAVHNATDSGALVTRRGRRYDFTYRYESWVQYRSRPVRPRVDLAPLVDRLNDEEASEGSSGVTWVADHVSGLTPVLSMAGNHGDENHDSRAGAESSLAPARFVALVQDHLRTAPPAWDPYRVTR
jgi:hypothetical protein